jgi:hypothetical protein
MKLRIALFMLAFCAPAVARNDGQWVNSPMHIRQWFQSLMQPDNPAMSCCGEADAFEADSFEVVGDHYVAIVTDGKGVIPNGTRIAVPNAKLKWDKGTRLLLCYARWGLTAPVPRPVAGLKIFRMSFEGGNGDQAYGGAFLSKLTGL